MQGVSRLCRCFSEAFPKPKFISWKPWVLGTLLLILESNALAYDVRLTVTYNTPGIVYGPISFGLASLPATVESTFIFNTDSLVQVDDDVYTIGLDGITNAQVAFGSGEWTQLDYFELIVEFLDSGDFGGAVDFIDLHYGFHPIAPEGVANGITVNSSFVLSVSGTNTSSNENFLYKYTGSTQMLELADEDNDGVLDTEDYCVETAIPEAVPTSGTLMKNQYALTNSEPADDGLVYFTSTNKTRFTTNDTGGCSCEQILDTLGLGKGGLKFGCSQSQMKSWIQNLP